MWGGGLWAIGYKRGAGLGARGREQEANEEGRMRNEETGAWVGPLALAGNYWGALPMAPAIGWYGVAPLALRDMGAIEGHRPGAIPA